MKWWQRPSEEQVEKEVIEYDFVSKPVAYELSEYYRSERKSYKQSK